MEIRGYRFRAYPTQRQQRQLAQEFGAARWVYNRGLETISRAWRERGERITSVDFSRQLTKLKQAEFPWLREASSYVLTQSLRDLDSALNAFKAKRARYPRFKKRRQEQAVRYQLDGRLKNSYVAGSRLVLPKLGPLKLVWSRLPKGRPKMATVRCDGVGRYFVSMAMEEEIPPLPATDRAVGVDAGLSAAVTFDDGTKVAPPRYLERRLKQVKRRSRDLSRAKRGSRRRVRTRWRLARVHARVRDCRRDWLHQLSSTIVHDSQVICVEDLNVSGMLRNRHLSRALADGALAELQRQLEYKALWYGRTFVRVGRWFPSTKRCSACGFVVEKLPMSARRWKCPECGIEHDRDVNAAINIRQEGLRILELPRGPREVKRVEGEHPLAGRRVPLTSGRPGKRESQESEARAQCQTQAEIQDREDRRRLLDACPPPCRGRARLPLQEWASTCERAQRESSMTFASVPLGLARASVMRRITAKGRPFPSSRAGSR